MLSGHRFLTRFSGRHPFNFKMSLTRLTLLVAVFLVLFANVSFWRALAKVVDPFILSNLPFLGSVFVFLVVFINLCLTLLCHKYTAKPLLVLILLTSVAASYFMDRYGTLIDKTMVQNVLETDPKEAFDLLSFRMLPSFFLLGILPSFWIVRTKIQYRTFWKEVLAKLGVVLGSLLVVALIAIFFYKDYSIIGRNNRPLRHLINPVNYSYALGSNVKRLVSNHKIVVQPLGEDARLATTAAERGKKNIVVLVVGETARAANFSLDGYARETNPQLSQRDVINFTNVYSCGTATATSLPCMFSVYGREDYSDAKAKSTENLLDVLTHAGVKVLWRDNNSGGKGVCDRVTMENLMHQTVEGLCTSEECYDMILLQDLQTYVDGLNEDAVIVLHQKGSHGPAYYLRVPEAFKQFTPVCATNQVQECSDEAIVNAYDNTILYTDYFLSQVIDFLKKNSEQNNTAMIYVSDHGESLGENNIYLHGMPYFIAPDEQKHVPFVLWLSDGFAQSDNLEKAQLRKIAGRPFSHDNLFHSVLGLMGVRTQVYDPKLDIFRVSKGLE